MVSSLSCSPGSLVAPSSSACTVTLSAAAPTGGASVSLFSNNASVTVPASVTVAEGATTGALTANVASVSTAQTATLAATLGGVSFKTFVLSISPSKATSTSKHPRGISAVTPTLGSSAAGSGTTVTTNDSTPTAEAHKLGVAQESTISTPGSAVTMFNPAGGLAGDVCSPGGLASLSGQGFTSQGPQKATSYPLSTSLANVQVEVNGEAAPLLFASASRVNFQCPQLPPGSPLDVTLVAENGVRMPAAASTMAAAAPGVFTVDDATQGVILIASTNQIAMPETKGILSRLARPGEYVTIYSGGLGEVVEGVPAGTQAPLNRQIQLQSQIRIFVGDVEIAPKFAGLAPGTVGVFQINAQLPQNVPVGPAVPLHIEVILPDGTVVESNEVRLAIKAAGETAEPMRTP